MLTPEIIKELDPLDMRGKILFFYKQAEEAVAIGKSIKFKLKDAGIQNILLAGMGGSAIGGDLLRSCLGDQLNIPFSVNRHYKLPPFVGDKTLVIVSSYSGNTEETLDAYSQAIGRKAKILCITSGGEVADRAVKHNHDIVYIPGGLQPRAALGYSFFPLLYAFVHAGFAVINEIDINETITVLKTISGESADITDENLSYSIAAKLFKRIPVLWSSSDLLEPVNLRWRGQINENAKQIAYGGWLPELNHNEIVGWQFPADLLKSFVIVLLRDIEDHPRVIQRMAITRELLEDRPDSFIELAPRGESRLARMFSMIHRGDWVSYYLAMLNRVDPTPVGRINYLKEQLERTGR